MSLHKGRLGVRRPVEEIEWARFELDLRPRRRSFLDVLNAVDHWWSWTGWPATQSAFQWIAPATVSTLKILGWVIALGWFGFGLFGCCKMIWDHPWLAVVAFVGTWIYACHKSERVANTTAIVALCALIAIPLVFFSAAVALAAPFVALAEAPIAATLTILAAIGAALFFGGGG